MFGSDSDDDTAEEVLAAATVASAARVAAAVVPRKLLNNAAVLLYRCGQQTDTRPGNERNLALEDRNALQTLVFSPHLPHCLLAALKA